MILNGSRPMRELPFSDWLDVIWAHLLSNTGAFTNPFEYREVMCAVVGYSDKTVEQVEAEHEARREEREKQRRADRRIPGAPPKAGVAQPKASEMAKFNELLALAKPREPAPPELGPAPDGPVRRKRRS